MPQPGQYPWMVFNPWIFANYGAPHTTRQRGYVSPIVYQTHQPRLSRILSSGTWAKLGGTLMGQYTPVSKVPTTFYVPVPAPGPVRIPDWIRNVFGVPPGMPPVAGLGRARSAVQKLQTTFYKVQPLPPLRSSYPYPARSGRRFPSGDGSVRIPGWVKRPGARVRALGQYEAGVAPVGVIGGVLGLALSVYMIWNMVKIRQAVEKTAGVRRNRRRRRARRRRR